MATFDLSTGETEPLEPLIGRSSPIDSAAETMMAASRTMLSAASAISLGLSPPGTRERELTAEAVEIGFLRALRRDSLLGGAETAGDFPTLLRLPSGKGISGTGYGRMGASITGSGARSQLYGTIGGAIGHAVGGPVGAVLGGMLGGLFGGDDDDEEERRREEERQWLNSPEAFEIQSYLYNLATAYAVTWGPDAKRGGALTSAFAWPGGSMFGGGRVGQISVNMSPGAVQIVGQGEESGERAARAFAGALGRVLRLNSVVVPAAGMGGDI